MANCSAQKAPLIQVHQPTIVAFFPPVTQAELSKEPDTNESLNDFQLYVAQARQPLEKEGINLKVIYARRFQIRRGNTVTTVMPKKVQVGYYFVAPDKKPLMENGVMTDADLLQVAGEYFGTSIPLPKRIPPTDRRLPSR